jgi:hypothetical protein
MDDKQRLAIIKRLVDAPSDMGWLMDLCERQHETIEETLRDIVSLLTVAKNGGLVDSGRTGRSKTRRRRLAETTEQNTGQNKKATGD